MIVSQKAHCHFLVFFSGAKDDNKPPSSSSSFGFFSSNAEDDDDLRSFRLIVISWVFFQM